MLLLLNTVNTQYFLQTAHNKSPQGIRINGAFHHKAAAESPQL